MARRLLPIVLLVLAGCNHGLPTAPGDVLRPLPAQFRVTGTAASTEADGTTVSCQLDLQFELGPGREVAGGLEYEGIYGGDIQRTVLDATGNGISLWPDVFGEVVARSMLPNRVELTFPVNVDSESRFYRELARLEGIFVSNSSATGSWSCAPFDIDSGGWVDTRYTAQGTWTLTPIS